MDRLERELVLLFTPRDDCSPLVVHVPCAGNLAVLLRLAILRLSSSIMTNELCRVRRDPFHPATRVFSARCWVGVGEVPEALKKGWRPSERRQRRMGIEEERRTRERRRREGLVVFFSSEARIES